MYKENKDVVKNRSVSRIFNMLLLSFVLCISPVAAQEWNISLGGGSHSLKYSLEQGEAKSSFGGSVGVGYTAFASEQIGVSFGLEASMFGSSLNMGSLSTEYPIQTPPGLQGNFVLHTDYNSIEERQRAVFVQVPLMLQFQLSIGEESFFYLAAGAKAGFAISKMWTQTVGMFTATGYSDYTNQVYENMPSHGFETLNGYESTGAFELGTPVTLAVEGGLKFKISNKNVIYTGVYLDYGLTDIGKAASKQLIEYNAESPANYINNSVLQTDRLNSSQGVKLFATGVKLKIAFGSGKSKKSSVPPALLGMR